MSKCILIKDTPNSCSECNSFRCATRDNPNYCIETLKSLISMDIYEARAVHCPLQFINQPTITSEEIVKELNELKVDNNRGWKYMNNKDGVGFYIKSTQSLIGFVNGNRWQFDSAKIPLKLAHKITTFFKEDNNG